MNHQFLKDLKEALEYEKLIFNTYLSSKFKLIEYNNDYRYDIKCQSIQHNYTITIEVKADSSPDSTNLCFEYKSRDKISGVFKTESDYFFYYFIERRELFIFKTIELKELLGDNEKFIDLKQKYLRYGGDANTSCLLVIPEKKLIEEGLWHTKIKI